MATNITELRARAQAMEREGAKPAPADPTELTLKTLTSPLGRAVWYPDTAILTREEVAQVLDVDAKTVAKWGIRSSYPSRTVVRYLYRDVVAFLESHAA